MKKIIFVPIEPLEARYSKQWNKWFEQAFEHYSINFMTINADPLISGKINVGQFLDVIGTNHYKSQQLTTLCRLINYGHVTDGDIIFFEDYWFPGVEMLFYIRDGANIKFKIAGILHAGTWDQCDFLTQKGMKKWAKRIETSWIEQADAIFVATAFHKDLIERNFDSRFSNIHITGLPIYPSISKHSATLQTPKINLYDKPITANNIVFPHRLAPEKGEDEFNDFLAHIPDAYIPTKTAAIGCLDNKEEYYNVLTANAFALSFALQETFGIAMIESVLCGCIPLVPDRLSYFELYPEIFKFSLENSTTKFDYLTDPKNKTKITDTLHALQRSFLIKGASAIPNMLGHMLKL